MILQQNVNKLLDAWPFFFLNFVSQKYAANADLPSEQEDEDTDIAFNKLRESDDSPELETPKPIPAKTAVKKTSVKKKSVRSSPPLKFRFEKKVNHFTKFFFAILQRKA